MKQISLLALLICLFCGVGKAATISGTVTNVTTSTVVANQKMYIYDSIANWTDSTLTNSSGVYSFTIPSFVNTGDFIMIYTTACGAYSRNITFYSGTYVANFSVCGGAIQLHGNIFLGSPTVANAGPAIVYLVRKQYDPVVMDTTLTALDSVTTSGPSYYMSFSAIPSGTLLLKAALKSGNASYWSFLPTYYYNTITNVGALPLSSANFSSSNLTHISMVAGVNPGGTGFIGGSVLLGANKATAVGDPLNNRILLLTTAAGQAVAYTYSDASGKFSFPNLAYGSYKIFGDAWGKSNPALTVTISAAAATINNVVFEENSKTFKGHIGNLAVNGGNALQALSIYPNPANNFVSFNGLSNISGSKTAILRDVTGAVISTTEIAAGTTANISINTLPAGMYMLQLQTIEGSASFRFVKD